MDTTLIVSSVLLVATLLVGAEIEDRHRFRALGYTCWIRRGDAIKSPMWLDVARVAKALASTAETRSRELSGRRRVKLDHASLVFQRLVPVCEIAARFGTCEEDIPSWLADLASDDPTTYCTDELANIFNRTDALLRQSGPLMRAA